MKHPIVIHPTSSTIHYGNWSRPRTLCGLRLCRTFTTVNVSRIPKAERRYCKKCQKINDAG